MVTYCNGRELRDTALAASETPRQLARCFGELPKVPPKIFSFLNFSLFFVLSKTTGIKYTTSYKLACNVSTNLKSKDEQAMLKDATAQFPSICEGIPNKPLPYRRTNRRCWAYCSVVYPIIKPNGLDYR